MRSSRGNKQHAKQFNNVVSGPVWSIPFQQMCPPYLHIFLGIVKKHHKMLQSTCHDLDFKIAEDLAQMSDKIDKTTKNGRSINSMECRVTQIKKKRI